MPLCDSNPMEFLSDYSIALIARPLNGYRRSRLTPAQPSRNWYAATLGQARMEPAVGFEPTTCWLQISYSNRSVALLLQHYTACAPQLISDFTVRVSWLSGVFCDWFAAKWSNLRSVAPIVFLRCCWGRMTQPLWCSCKIILGTDKVTERLVHTFFLLLSPW